MNTLFEYRPNVWIIETSLVFYGIPCNTRMTIIKLNKDNELLVHSPIDINDNTKSKIDYIGTVKYIIAPNSMHWLFLHNFSALYPLATIYISPPLQKKLDLSNYKVLNTNEKEIFEDVVLKFFIKGNSYLSEFVFYHIKSKTLILTDFIENIPTVDENNNFREISYMGQFWMWFLDLSNKIRPSPEFQYFTDNFKEIEESLNIILAYEIDSVIISHGVILDHNNVNNISETIYNTYQPYFNKTSSCLIQ